jgi:hypothetical protein
MRCTVGTTAEAARALKAAMIFVTGLDKKVAGISEFN